MDSEESTYHSFLLRLWLVNDNGRPAWRASLEQPRTGERKGFSNLDDLGLFLEQLTISTQK